jgi:hypothetical protein
MTSPFAQFGRYRRAAIGAACIAVCLYLALLVLYAKTRKPWNDEAASARAGFNLSDKGHTGVEFLDEKASGFPGVHRHTYYIFPLQLFSMAVWYKIAGFSLFTTRLLSILWTCVFLIAWCYVLQRLTRNAGMALLGTVFAATDYHIMSSASFGRYDTMVAALGYCSYAIYLGLREKRLPLALFAANACIAASGATQPNGLFYFVGLWLMVLFCDRSRVGWREMLVSAAPYAGGGVLWAAYILQDQEAFLGQMGRNTGGRFGLLHPIDTLLAEIQMRYITAFGLGPHSVGHNSFLIRLKALPLAAYLVGALGCLLTPAIRRNPAYRLLLLLSGAHWFMMTFGENMKYSFYLIHMLPFFGALLSVWLVHLWQERRVPPILLAGAIAVVMGVQIGGVAMKIRLNDHDTVYLPAVNFLKNRARPGEMVAATSSFGFDYGFDTGLLDEDTFGYASGKKPDFIVMEEIYEDQHHLYKQQAPGKYKYIQDILDSYKLIYTGGEYRIYERPGKGAAGAGTHLFRANAPASR